MKYAFRFTAHAQRQLRSIDRQDALRILTAITPLGDDPWREDADVKKLSGHDGLYRVRAGEFRVVYEVRGDVLVILVLHLGHRSDVYRKL
ncbi:type II toxin-antitoxin system RelE/ParE family toxin [Streptomyces sp. NPDC049967]|uniref:type II toxin-antitoxin system RelE family toxin n=1 Tax=Streptomyces TaxID=1883 RepID=UPI001A93FA7A|nr:MULTISPECIES: type II toxin-antitoxin system RelE/ParE family toxin [Streptomyces]MBO0919017.1 type II toxin-antitoxin system RelE/ParE family toxin [Streptomyces laculatispora]WRZ13927.1 type II toxin-antitoxin system RelE/ParE family toxin [Streptomyces sp. NBC_00341]WSJ24867.1 type II toxin-antitoxin system RelE/ParE family toxin [Streptomyces sp. NBC_01324]